MVRSNAVKSRSLRYFLARIYARAGVSLKNRIILLTSISVLLSTVALGTLNYLQIENLVLKTAVEKLPRETRLLAQKFRDSYDELTNDTRSLSEAPPIEGLIRNVASIGIDPSDHSTSAEWKSRLASIFEATMRSRPHYAQIRLIGVADGGRELVRINRGADGPNRVPVDQLQQKGAELYYALGLRTKPGFVHFSEVSYNREGGRVDPSLTPTIRSVTPVLGPDRKIFGLVVINARYDQMLHRAFAAIAPDTELSVVNGDGDYMDYRPDGSAGTLELHSHYTRPPPAYVVMIANAMPDEQLFMSDAGAAYLVKLNVDPGNPRAALGFISRTSRETLLRPANEMRTYILLSALALIVICFLASLYLSRHFTRPLERMTNEIKRSGSRQSLKNLPTARHDEIGDLARAFNQKARDLADSETKARAVIDNVVDGLITIDERGFVDSYNPACERIFGYLRDEVIGQNISMLMPEPHHSAHDRYLERYLKTGKRQIIGATRELSGRRKDGSTFPLELAVSELELNKKHMFSGIIRDISERKHMEVMKDEFVSTVNHELRTPLTSINGALALLMARSSDQVDEKSRKLLRLSYENCQRLSRLVNDILDIEKIAAGKLEYRIETARLCDLVRDIVDSQGSYAEKWNVAFELQFKDSDIDVRVDRDRFSQALVNLLSNAAKFSSEGEIVFISVQMKSANFVEITVTDKGPGIPDEFRSKIFSKFAQADSSETRSKGGSGLGLNIAKTIVEAFGGTIDYQSERGAGTTFSISLPVVQPEKMSA